MNQIPFSKVIVYFSSDAPKNGLVESNKTGCKLIQG